MRTVHTSNHTYFKINQSTCIFETPIKNPKASITLKCLRIIIVCFFFFNIKWYTLYCTLNDLVNFVIYEQRKLRHTSKLRVKLGTYNFMMINKILQYKMYLDNK